MYANLVKNISIGISTPHNACKILTSLPNFSSCHLKFNPKFAGWFQRPQVIIYYSEFGVLAACTSEEISFFRKIGILFWFVKKTKIEIELKCDPYMIKEFLCELPGKTTPLKHFTIGKRIFFEWVVRTWANSHLSESQLSDSHLSEFAVERILTWANSQLSEFAFERKIEVTNSVSLVIFQIAESIL